MDLVRHSSSEYLSVRSIGVDGIRIGEGWYKHSLILTATSITPLPNVNSLADIDNKLIETALLEKPDAVLIGTGQTLVRPSRTQYLDWLNSSVGVEIMDSRAACRTFNVLVSEDRPVAAILIRL